MNANSYAATIIDELIDNFLLNINKQKELFEQLSTLELQKERAIIERDAILLESISKKEAEQASLLDTLEGQRQQVLQSLADSIQEEKADSISALLASEKVPQKKKSIIEKDTSALRLIALSVKKSSEANQLMLKDSNEFFQLMIKSLSSTEELGYAPEGNKNSNRPVFVDTNC